VVRRRREVTDEEVVAVLSSRRGAYDADVVVEDGALSLGARLTVPEGANAVVAFAHGSGSSRHSGRNRHVAAVLNDHGLGTLLLDLLTTDEAEDRRNVFDVPLLAGRVGLATRWLRERPETRGLPVAYFGASTGAAAALWAAAEPGSAVVSVVSRGGRPDLAAERLGLVRAPALLVVGSLDTQVLDLNRRAAAMFRCEHRLDVVPGASHLFEEPGTLDRAADLAREWFLAHLPEPG
jgi:alpha-beta hydrolase superfamily lysophospholipase